MATVNATGVDQVRRDGDVHVTDERTTGIASIDVTDDVRHIGRSTTVVIAR